MFDNNNNNPDIGLHQTAVWVDNVVHLFKKYNIPTIFDLLSVDTDFNDFWNLREIMLAGYRPRVVIVEVLLIVALPPPLVVASRHLIVNLMRGQ
jgi:hypothetical protein